MMTMMMMIDNDGYDDDDEIQRYMCVYESVHKLVTAETNLPSCDIVTVTISVSHYCSSDSGQAA